MRLDLGIPSIVPVMTLRETVLFPQAILPLYIYEPRYRHMLSDVLASDRLFAVACNDCERAPSEDDEDVPARMATMGIVRAANAHHDGTSNLVLQGVCRVHVLGLDRLDPYPRIRVEPVVTAPAENPAAVQVMRDQVAELLQTEPYLANDVPAEFMEFLTSLDDADTFIDLTAFAICQNSLVKQRLLEALPLEERYHAFLKHLNTRREEAVLHRRLQGGTGDAEIELN